METAAETVRVRPGLEPDVAAVTAIYAHHVRHGTASFETEPPVAAEMVRRRDEILARNLPYLVAEQDGVVLGYAYAGPYRLRAAYRHSVEDSVYLRPDAVGLGVGRRLLAVLLDRCEALGLRQVVAVIGDSANLRSIRLHENLGFRRVGTLRSIGHKHGRWLDSVLLQRALGAGDASPPGGPGG